VLVVNLQCRRQTPRTPGEIQKPRGSAMMLHQVNSLQWFKGADQDTAGDAVRFAADVQHEMGAIVKENVGVTVMQIHGAYAWSGTAIVMACWVAGRVGFSFHNAPTHTSAR